MALVSSLFTAISGLRNHQTMLDVISNNVSNVNTIGFKSGRVMFRDMLSQTLLAASPNDPATNRGGTNPLQTGTGVAVASIDTIQSQGALQATGIATDLAVQGDGFFVVESGSTRTYTRAGMFRFDSAGQLVDPSGALVQGWMASTPTGDPLGRTVIDATDPTAIGAITINSGMTMKPYETRNVELAGNLDAGATAANCGSSIGEPGTVQIQAVDSGGLSTSYNVGTTDIAFTIFDSLGNAHQLTMTLMNLSGTQIPGAAAGIMFENNTWAWTVNTDSNDSSVHLAMDNTTYTDPLDASNTIRASSSGTIHFNTDGSVDYVTYMDRNGSHFGTQNAATSVYNDEGIPGGTPNRLPVAGPDANGWLPLADADALDDAVIGFEGATVPTVANANFPNVQAWQMVKLPIVLCYQYVDNAGATIPTTPVPPFGTSAGTQATLDLASSGTTQDWFVQSFDINWGTVSNITAAAIDTAGAAGDFGLAGDGAASHDYTSVVSGVVRSAWGQRDGLTQDTAGRFDGVVYKPNCTPFLRSQDGYPEGVLQSLSVDQNGVMIGSFTNGLTQDLARIAMARFENPAGLAKMGETHFTPTSNSGEAVVGTANTNGRGSIVGGALEQSNVDLSKELTDMIVAQRGFEVNARLVTTSDRILDTLVNLGR